MARPSTDPRKTPVQARSTQLVADILQAAIRVLEKEGAERFTTIRVAEAAGVSVGSLYQYFPNKQAILFRLQADEWQRTGALVERLLGDTSRPVEDRLRRTLRAFFQSECDEAPLRRALDAAAPIYRDSPESSAAHTRSRRLVRAFVADAAPHAPPRQRAFAADLVVLTMTSLGEQLSERRPSKAQVTRWADETTRMLLGYLERWAAPARDRTPAPVSARPPRT